MRLVDLLIVAVWFAASRSVVALAGVAWDRVAFQQLWQVLPLEHLTSRPVESLWYLHSQPPLYNLLLGVLLHLPGDTSTSVHICWLAAGLTLAVSMVWALLVAGMPRVTAHLITAAFAVNPTVLLYENFVLYAYPEAVGVLTAFTGIVLLGRGHVAGATIAGASACALVGFRALYQPWWALAWAAAVYGSLARSRWTPRTLLWLAAPAMVGLALVLKNGTMFGVWSSSSWYGMNLAKLAMTAVSEETAQLVRDGVVSPAFALGTFRPLEAYPPALVHSMDARMLDRHGLRSVLFETHSRAGSPNFNHVGYLAVSRQLAEDSLAVFSARPGRVEQTIKDGFRLFLRPASNYPLLNPNRPPLERLEGVYLAAIYPAGSTALVGLGIALALVSATWVWVDGLRTRHWMAPAAGYVLVTIVWVTVTGNLAEYGENNRFRFAIDPMVFTWNGMIAARFWTWTRTRTQRQRPP